MPHRPLSVLSHVELLTPQLDASVAFARDILGLDVVAEEGDSVYLRCWGDYYGYSLVLTAAAEPGLGHGAWRAWNAEQLDDRRRIRRGRRRHRRMGRVVLRPRPRVPLHRPGRATPRSSSGTSTARSRRPARSPRTRSARSAAARAASAYASSTTSPSPPPTSRPRRSGTRTSSTSASWAAWRGAGTPPGSSAWPAATRSRTTSASSWTATAQPGRLHHVAFWVETNHDLTQGAKFLIEHGHDIDFGPGQHGIGEQHYLYFRDPVGLRYELNSGGYRNYVPDWEPAIWRFEDGPNNTYRTEIGMPAVHMAEIPPGHRRPPRGDDPGHRREGLTTSTRDSARSGTRCRVRRSRAGLLPGGRRAAGA